MGVDKSFDDGMQHGHLLLRPFSHRIQRRRLIDEFSAEEDGQLQAGGLRYCLRRCLSFCLVPKGFAANIARCKR